MTRPKDDQPTSDVEAEERIERFFAFVQDVLDDPSTLDRIPDKATIDLTPLEGKDSGERYVTETRRFAVKVLPPRVSVAGAGKAPYVRRTNGQHGLPDGRKRAIIHPGKRSA